jgi:hypothetical protein
MTTSLPWMNRGAAGKKRTPLAMMAPVNAPERSLPLDCWEARRGARSDRKTHFVDAHVEFTGAAQAPFQLRVHNRAPGHRTLRDHHQAVYFDVFCHLKINPVAGGFLGRRKFSGKLQRDRRAVFEAEGKCRVSAARRQMD